ncbi:MAG TPA: dynamin family protein [Kofleriaceae bacterium]|nr:dynamin family protein [Kofleriaceae bacterium]
MSSLPESHRALKTRLLEHLAELATIAERTGMRTLAGDIRRERIPKLADERFHLVVLGEFNHGKSTFVNALLGARVLPTGITPTTAVINRVVWAEAPTATAVTRDGEVVKLAPADIDDWVTVEGKRSTDLAHVEVGYPADILRDNIVLVDTPGVNDLNEQRAEITYGYVPRADAVIFLLDAGQALKDSEREFLASHVLEGSRDRLVFVLGKIDLLGPAERDAVEAYVRKGLTRLVAEPALFSVSAKSWLEGQRDESGFAPLVDHLARFLATDRARVLLDNAAADAGRAAAYLEQNLGLKLHACQLDIADLEKRVASVHAQLDASKRKLDELHGRIKADSAAIKSQAKLDMDLFARAFVAALPEQIDAVDAADVKRYLGSFIQDKFREWTELEGAKVGALLEQLAEDVISVTNENAAEAAAALASRLGPADTAVEIDVDSFKYDVGVYAVGALGTTMLFFVNALAGGLLTLAAPILAIILKSKVAGDIREQAKERVPGVVLRAADAMGPHFTGCIDDFARRLSDFVTAAGNTLYRGISEILDQTISERRRGEVAAAAVLEETGDKARAVAGIRVQVDALRGELWRLGVDATGGITSADELEASEPGSSEPIG